MPKDPVCGMEIEEFSAARTLSYGGETYYFCAPGCLREFTKQPEKYLTDQLIVQKDPRDVPARVMAQRRGHR